METEVSAQFDAPETVAIYIGEAIGVHYSAALRAAEAYGRYLAPSRKSLQGKRFLGDGLGRFWAEMMKSEQVQASSPAVLKALNTDPSYYHRHLLDTADSVFKRRYEEVPPAKKKKIGQTQHKQCLRIMRNQDAEGIGDHFTVRNKVATWIQLIRAVGGYRE